MWLEKHRIVLKIDKAPKLVGSNYEVGVLVFKPGWITM